MKMNKKLIFRILGALFSALIIVSVFVPFVSVTGFSQSLWQTYKYIDALYLPIMIIIFGAIGVVFFSLNIKTEFAYMSTGAIMFFAIMQTVDVVNQGVFSTLSIGYYFLVIGALLTGLMAFLCNLKDKTKVVQPVNNDYKEPSMINKIDQLYDNQSQVQNPSVNDMIQPQIQPIQNITETEVNTPIEPIQPINQVVEPQMKPIPDIVQSQVVSTPVEPIRTINEVPQVQSVQPVQSDLNEQVIPENPVMQQFNKPSVNPVLQEFADIKENNFNGINNQTLNQPQMTEQNIGFGIPNMSQSQSVNPTPQPFNNTANQGITNQNINNGGTDIFGQPINRN